MWFLFAIISAIFAALVAIFGKIGLSEVDSTLATTVRALFMFLFVLAGSAITGKLSGLNTINGKALKFIILSGIAGGLSWLFYFSALKMGVTSKVAAIDRLSIVFIFFLSILFLGETLTLKHVLGIALVAIGAILTIG